MALFWNRATKIIGILGTVISIALFIRQPSFPTPDKLLVFITFVFMMFNQGWEVFKRLAPFIALLLVYESFRGFVPHLNSYVNYSFMPAADKVLFFGHLPTAALQNAWWHGHVAWYDFAFYGAYTLHFVLPVVLALVIWKYREKFYWRYITTYLVVSFAGFLTFLVFPAAPPWMAAQVAVIQPIQRISSNVFFAIGFKDFPSVYNKLSPNPVAAVPSLHAAYATLFALFVTVLFWPPAEKRTKNIRDINTWHYSWYTLRWLAWIHPLLIWFGTVYQGEHYAFDELVGIIYAVGAWFLAPHVLKFVIRSWHKVRKLFSSTLQEEPELLQ